MPRQLHNAVVLVAAGVVIALGGCARVAGEAEYDPRPYVEACREAAAAAGGPATERATYAAVHHVAGSCSHLPVHRLPELWASVPADTSVLRQLYAATGWRGQGRPLFRALVEAATDSARPVLVRTYALAALIEYFVPGTGSGPHDLQDTAGYPGVVQLSHPGYAASSSILPSDKDAARGALHLAMSREPDRIMWHALTRVLASINNGIDRWDEIAAAECRALADAWSPDGLSVIDGESSYQLQGCTVDGPRILADAWERVGADSAALDPLFWTSQVIRDERILRAVLDVARDRARPAPVRFAALHTAATLADPAMYSMGAETWKRDPGTCHSWWGWHHHHAVQEDGAVPLSSGSREEIRAELARIAAAEHDPDVRRLAALLSRCIAPPEVAPAAS